MSLLFLIFYILPKESISKIMKNGFFSTKNFFLFLKCSIFCRFFTFLSTVFRLKGSDQKTNFSKQVLQLKEKLVTSSKPCLFLIITSIKKNLVQRKKNKLVFSLSLLTLIRMGYLEIHFMIRGVGERVKSPSV